MKTVNRRFLLIVLATLIVGGVVVSVLHAFQMSRHVAFYYEQFQAAEKAAEDAEKRSDHRARNAKLQEAIAFLGFYRENKPDDLEAQAKLGELLGKSTQRDQHDQAIKILTSLVREKEVEKELEDRARRRLVGFLVEQGQGDAAADHLDRYLLKDAPNDVELLFLRAKCHEWLGDRDKARERWRQVIKLDPQRLEAYGALAASLERNIEVLSLAERERAREEAAKVMREMVDKNPKSSNARLLYASYLARHQKGAEAEKALAEAARLNPDDAAVLTAEIISCLERNDAAGARKRLDRLRKVASESALLEVCVLDAKTCVLEKSREKAIEILREGLKKHAGHLLLLQLLTELQFDLLLSGDPAAASATEDVEKNLEAFVKPPLAERLAVWRDAWAEFFRGRLAQSRGDWREAVEHFQRAQDSRIWTPPQRERIVRLRASCWEKLGDSEKLKEVVDELGVVGEALFARGQYAACLEAYSRSLDKLDEITPRTVSILILANMQLKGEQQNWACAEKALEKLKKQADAGKADPHRAELLRAELLLAKRERPAGQAALLELCKKEGAPPEAWVRLAALLIQDKNYEKADALLDRAVERLKDSATLRAARAELFVARDGPAAAERLAALARGAESFRRDEAERLYRTLVACLLRIDKPREAAALCEEFAKKEPKNLNVRLILLDLAVRRLDNEAALKVLEEIKAIEGDQPGYWNFGQAARLRTLAATQPAQRAAYAREALRHLDAAAKYKPNWPYIPYARALIYDRLLDDEDRALELYLQAIKGRLQEPEGLRRAVQLLIDRRRLQEAEEVMRDAGEGGALGQEFQQMLLPSDFNRALEAATRAAARSAKSQDHLWLGQLLILAAGRAAEDGHREEIDRRLDEAEKELRRAAELGPAEIQTWRYLVALLVQRGRGAEARKLLDQATAKIPAEARPLALAQLYQAMGDLPAAEKQYAEALAAQPNHRGLLRAAVAFYTQTGNIPQAEAIHRRVLADPASAEDDRAEARGELALLYAIHGSRQNRAEALAMVEKNLAERPDSVPDLRAKAILLATEGGKERVQDAIVLLERLALPGAGGKPEDRFLLSQLYLNAGQWEHALQHMRGVLAVRPGEPRFLIPLIQTLAARGQREETDQWLKRLERAAPDHAETMRLRTQWCFAARQYDDIQTRLGQWVDRLKDRKDKADAALLAAAWCEGFARQCSDADSRATAAEFARRATAWAARHVELNPGEPLVLAGFLAAEGRRAEAFDLAGKSWPKATAAQVFEFAPRLLQAPGITAADRGRLEALLKSAAEKLRNPAILVRLAECYQAQGRHEEAEEAFRRLIAQDQLPQDLKVATMNNLAYALALRKVRLDEAAALVEQALKLASSGAILDTQGVVLLARDKPAEALAAFNAALAEEKSSMRYFHQAQALARQNAKSEAAAALKSAVELGLRRETLLPLEQPAYDALRKLVP